MSSDFPVASSPRATGMQPDELTRLVASRDLRIACQPIIDLRDGAILGFECLSRFPRGWKPEGVFAAAHLLGVGLELEAVAIDHALQRLPQVREDQFLSLNLSPPAAIAFAHTGGARGVATDARLVIEITEHAAVNNYTALRRTLAPLRQRGLRIAVDDAGAGYASLRHVVELQPDFIKVDRSLVHGIATDHARRIAVSSFVLLALDLNACVIAEGVESPADLGTLCDLGVDAAQGYLLARPTTNTRQLSDWTTARQQPSAAASR
jgi:EAL domain-containing protein (putative c-di-GMP-specific phosphodiesterase class I)